MANGYPFNIIKKTIRSVEYDRSNTNTASSTTIEKIYISMPYYGELSNVLANKIKHLLKIKNKNKYIIFGFKAGYRLSSIFRQTYCGSNVSKKVVYKYNCKDCNGCYMGETSRGVEKRKEEHQKALQGKGYSRIAEHCTNYTHENDCNAEIIGMEANDTKRTIKESLLMEYFQRKGKSVYFQKSFELKVF